MAAYLVGQKVDLWAEHLVALLAGTKVATWVASKVAQ